MSDRYQSLVASGAGARTAKALGLPRPERLRRSSAGDVGLPGPVLVVAAPEHGPVRQLVASLGHQIVLDPEDADETKLGAVVVDALSAATVTDLESLRAGLAPALRRLAPCGRVVVLGRPPVAATMSDVDAATVQQSLEG